MNNSNLSKTWQQNDISEISDPKNKKELWDNDTKKNIVQEYSWKTIEVKLNECSRNTNSSSKSKTNFSKGLKQSYSTNCLYDSNKFKGSNKANKIPFMNSKILKDENLIKNKVSNISKQTIPEKQFNSKDTNVKFNEILSLQKRLIQSNTIKKIKDNHSVENVRDAKKDTSRKSSISDEATVSVSHAAPLSKQKPYTSFIDCANKRKTQAAAVQKKETITHELIYSSPTLGWTSGSKKYNSK